MKFGGFSVSLGIVFLVSLVASSKATLALSCFSRMQTPEKAERPHDAELGLADSAVKKARTQRTLEGVGGRLFRQTQSGSWFESVSEGATVDDRGLYICEGCGEHFASKQGRGKHRATCLKYQRFPKTPQGQDGILWDGNVWNLLEPAQQRQEDSAEDRELVGTVGEDSAEDREQEDSAEDRELVVPQKRTRGADHRTRYRHLV